MCMCASAVCAFLHAGVHLLTPFPLFEYEGILHGLNSKHKLYVVLEELVLSGRTHKT